jgi:branched-chain amino acid transport system substrate-binding protein
MDFRRSLQIFSLLLAAFSVLAISAPPSKAEKKIGLSLPLTGAAEVLARQYLIGAKLAISEIERTTGEKINLVIVDDGCDTELANLAASDLIKSGVDLVTGLLCNEAATVVASAYATTSIPILVAGARSERLIKDRVRESWNIWRLSPGDSDASLFAGKIFGDAWAGKAYAIVDDGTVYGRNLADAFRAVMEEKGLPSQFQDNFRPTQSTQARLIRRLRRAGITHVFVGASAEDVAMIANNANELNIDLEIAGGEILSIMPYLDQDILPPPGLQAIVEKSSVDLQLSEEMKILLEDNKIQPEISVLAGFQSIQVAFGALADIPEKTTSNLAEKTFETLLGPVSFSSDGRNTAQQYDLYIWTGSDFKQVTQ